MGFPSLDRQTGGMMPGEVIVIAGGISDAKSAFSENLSHAAVVRGRPTAIYTFEMSDDKLTDRFICIDAQIPNTSTKRGLLTQEESRKLAQATTRLMKYPLYIRDVSGMKLSALLGDMRTLKRRYKIEVFVIDYTQLIEPDKKGHTRESEVAEFSRKLKAASKNLGATVILLSQLNDQGKLRESRAIGADGDIVLTLSVPDKPEDEWENPEVPEKDETRRDLRISKNRDGIRGSTIKFHFHGATFTFTEQAEEMPESKPHHSDR
jgi:replicative DNA helicase